MALELTNAAVNGLCKPQPGFCLKIESQEDFKTFMRKVHRDFIRVVDPRESGLLDVLFANDVISESDNSSLSGKDVFTRKDQARKLFLILNHVSWKVFMDKVSPELCVKFPHILPIEFIDHSHNESRSSENDPSDECMRHVIEHRVRPSTVADMLYQNGALSVEQYGVIIEDARRKESKIWDQIFDVFQEALLGCDNKHVQSIVFMEIKDILRRYGLHVPRDLYALLRNGLPCTCNPTTPLPDKTLNFVSKVLQWMQSNKEEQVKFYCNDDPQCEEVWQSDSANPSPAPQTSLQTKASSSSKKVSTFRMLAGIISVTWSLLKTPLELSLHGVKRLLYLKPLNPLVASSPPPSEDCRGKEGPFENISLSDEDDFVTVANPSTGTSWHSFELESPYNFDDIIISEFLDDLWRSELSAPRLTDFDILSNETCTLEESSTVASSSNFYLH